MKVVCINPLLLLLLLLGLGACSTQPQPQPQIVRKHDYKVSVYQDGKEVKDYGKALIERIDVSPVQLAALSRAPAGLPFTGVRERDNYGKTKGLRIKLSKAPPGASVLGLREKDLVTAIGQKRVEQVEDFRMLARELQSAKMASLTLERDGKPHKILYYSE